MKKTILFVTVILMGITSSGQNLKKGALLGFHVMTVQLKPGVTIDDFKTMFVTKVIPAYENGFKGAKGYLTTGVRGEGENKLAVIWLFESEALRNMFFAVDGSLSALGNAAVEKTNGASKELEKLGTHTTQFTDWLIQ